jgi:hypothetical protein
MTPLNVGMYAMIAAGLGGIFVAFMTFRKKTADGIRRPLATSCVAVLLLGVGTFGPSFMEPYGKLLGLLVGADGSDQDKGKYTQSCNDIGANKTDDASAYAQIAYMLDHPVSDMDRIIDDSLKNASTDIGRQRLMVAKAALKVKEEEANRLIAEASEPVPAAPGHFPAPPAGRPPISLSAQDPGVRKLMERKLAGKPQADVQKLRFDDASKAILLKLPPPKNK